MCNFLRITVTFDRGASLGENLLMFLRNGVSQIRPYWTWADAVDGDALRTQINSERMCQTDHPRLRNDIRAITWRRAESLSGGDIDASRRVRPAQVR